MTLVLTNKFYSVILIFALRVRYDNRVYIKNEKSLASRENIYSRLTTQNGLYHTVGVGHIPTAPVELVCHILKLKCTKFDFDWGSAPDPLEELTVLLYVP